MTKEEITLNDYKCRDCKYLCTEKYGHWFKCLHPTKDWNGKTTYLRILSSIACKDFEHKERN